MTRARTFRSTRLRSGGFTLIELMITVAVVAILAAIAYPSYQEQVRKSRRSDAKSALLNVAQVMERRYSERAAYPDQATTKTLVGDGSAGSDIKSPDGYYLMTVTLSASPSGTAAQAYSLTAAPTGTQTGDKCGSFTLTNAGAKGVSGASAGYDAAKCW